MTKPQYHTTKLNHLTEFIRESGEPDLSIALREAKRWVREGIATLGKPKQKNDPNWIQVTPSAKKTFAFKLEVWKRKD
tara:strand:+ start:2673 stop:2906 length:234 start_codon:yes stop_codon:yes gene_type:complete